MENEKKVKEMFAILGPGRLRIVFPKGIYDQKVAEKEAIHRTKNLGDCRLYFRNEHGKIFQLYPIFKEIDKQERKKPVTENFYPEMLGNDSFVPGIQIVHK